MKMMHCLQCKFEKTLRPFTMGVLYQSQWEFHREFHALNFICHISIFDDLAWSLWRKRRGSFMGWEKSFIPMKPTWRDYLVPYFWKLCNETCIETGLIGVSWALNVMLHQQICWHGRVIYEERGEGVSWDDYIGDDRGVSSLWHSSLRLA